MDSGRHKIRPVDIEECPKKTDKVVWRRLNDQGKRYTIMEARFDMNFAEVLGKLRDLQMQLFETQHNLIETRNELFELKRKVYGSST